jgi:hypothetical protein
MNAEQDTRGTAHAPEGGRTLSDRIHSILKDAGRGGLDISELAREAGVDINEVEEIEAFYRVLREGIGTTIDAEGDHSENATVRLITDAS